MNGNPLALSARVLVGVMSCSCAAVLAGCTQDSPLGDASVEPVIVTQTAYATVTATPDPNDQSDPDPGEAPFAAVVTLASLSVEGTVVTVAGYVQGIVEDGGACVFTFDDATGSNTVAATSEGIDNVATTSCGSVDVPADSFARGSWSVTLTYSSPSGETTSEPLALEIP